MANDVTRRFVKCHDYLKEHGLVKSSRQFALSLEVHAQSINDILKGRRDATVDMLMKAASLYNINSDYLLLGTGEMFTATNEERDPNIHYVPIPAYAGCLEQYFDTVNTVQEQKFSLPGYDDSYGEHRCFDIEGDSMEPSLYAGDKVICRRLYNNQGYVIRDNYVYVIVTDKEILIKRILDRQREDGTLVLRSDNAFYQDITLNSQEIKELWIANMKIEPFVGHPKHQRTGLHQDIQQMRETIRVQGETIVSLNKSIERLLRKSRG